MNSQVQPEKTSHWIGNLALVTVIILQGGLMYITYEAAGVMQAEWPHKITVHTGKFFEAHDRHFWGPVNVLVPTRCSTNTKWHNKVGILTSTVEPEHEMMTLPIPAPAPAPQQAPAIAEKPIQTRRLDFLSATSGLTEQASSRRLQDPTVTTAATVVQAPAIEDDGHQSFHDELHDMLNPPIKVTVCGEEQVFEPVRLWNRYFSMITIGRYTGWETPTVDEMKENRAGLYKQIIFWISACMALKYSLKLVDAFTRCCGHKYVQLWNNGRTRIDRVLESLMLHGISIVYTLALQMALCSMYFSFWRDDHFVITYIPRVGFSIFFVSLIVITIFMVLDRTCGIMVSLHNWYIYCFWSVYILWMILIAVPMVAYTVYSLQFYYTVITHSWMEAEQAIFSPEFMAAAETGSRAAFAFVGIAIVDFVVIIGNDLERC